MKAKTNAPLASLVDLLVDAVFTVDADANIVFASAACERIFGYTPQEMVGKNMFNLMVRKNGQVVHIMWSACWSPVDQLRIGVARDITERKRAELMQAALYSISEAAYVADDLLALYRRIHQIVDTLLPADNFSVTLYDQETEHLSFPYHVDDFEPASKPSIPVAGTLCAEVIRTGQSLLLTPQTMATRLEQLHVSVAASPFCWLGVPLKSHKGTMGVLVLKSYPGGVSYSEEDRELLQFVSTQIATVIERQQMQIRLLHMAQHDQLTVLPNRGLLYDRLKVALSTARQERGRFSLLYIDLDKFKRVNDSLGHGAGDLLLQEVAKRLKQCVRESDTVSRVGGDEFVVLLQSISLPEQAAQMVERIHNALSHPFTIEGRDLSIVPSIGVALYPEDGDDEQQLIEHADKAMYSVKGGY